MPESDSSHDSTCAVNGDDDIHADASKFNFLVEDSGGRDRVCNALGLNLDQDHRNNVMIASTDASFA